MIAVDGAYTYIPGQSEDDFSVLRFQCLGRKLALPCHVETELIIVPIEGFDALTGD